MHPDSQVRQPHFITLFSHLIKLCLALVVVFLPTQTTARLVLTLILVSALLAVSVWHGAGEVASHRVLRVVMYLFAIWSFISALGMKLHASPLRLSLTSELSVLGSVWYSGHFFF